jgi:hypothetical protein
MSDPRHRPFLITAVVAVAAACLAVALTSGGSSGSSSNGSASTEPSTSMVTTDAPGDSAAPSSIEPTDSIPGGEDVDSLAPHQQDLVGADPAATEECTLTQRSLNSASSGSDVVCLQEALREAGYYSGDITGVYDNSVIAAVEKLQTDRDLFVDGKVGRETALSLGIWPDEDSLVVRTPPPPPGAVDLMGFPLSTVATSGPDAPPLPENSGSGRRVVYSRAGQRVWAVDENETVIRSWLVSGSKYNNETPGTHRVYSRSDVSTAWNGKAFLPKMIRWLKTDIGNIGFHAIPLHRSDNSPYQTEAELGSRLSGGCQRQANADADFMWEFAQIGTVVVVI